MSSIKRSDIPYMSDKKYTRIRGSIVEGRHVSDYIHKCVYTDMCVYRRQLKTQNSSARVGLRHKFVALCHSQPDNARTLNRKKSQRK